MPSESQIDRIEQLFDQAIRVGGQAERTAIFTNVTVQDAAPAGLTGRVIIQDPRDGNFVPAITIPGVVYNNNDLVNVLFIAGTEPLAFQQGSGSSTTNGLWQLESGTGPDIFYDDGNVGVGLSTVTAQLDVDQSSVTGAKPVLKLDQGDVSEQCIQFSSDSLDQDINLYTVDVTGTPTVLWDESEDAFSWNKGLRITSGSVAIGSSTAATELDVYGTNTTGVRVRGAASANEIADFYVGSTGNLIIDLTSGTDTSQYLDIRTEEDSFGVIIRESDGTGAATFANLYVTDAASDYLNIVINTGASTVGLVVDENERVGVGVTTLLAKLHVDQPSATGAIPVLYLDQGDVSEQCIQFSSDGLDQDINLYTVNVTGTPTVLWDESETSFSQNVGLIITSGDLLVPDDIVHHGDADTLLSFTDDAITVQAGGLTLLQLTETVQDLVEIGDVGGAGDVDVNFSSGQVFIRGSDGQVGINNTSPAAQLDIDQSSAIGAVPVLKLDQGDVSEQCIQFSSDGLDQDINLYTVDVTGTPTVLWDESESSFSQNVGLIITSGNLLIPDDIVHHGDADTLRSFTDDAIADQAGGVIMLRMTETAQDLVEIGDVGGAGDVDVNFGSGQLFLRGSDGHLGLGTTAPAVGPLSIFGLHIKESSANCGLFVDAGAAQTAAYYMGHGGTANWQFQSGSSNDFQIVETGAAVRFTILDSDNGKTMVGTGTPTAQLHVDQESTTAAIPVLYLDQADISEEMIEFNTTIGVGNAIEAVGAKTLTTTHFIKVTLPGALTRYIPCGTIA